MKTLFWSKSCLEVIRGLIPESADYALGKDMNRHSLSLNQFNWTSSSSYPYLFFWKFPNKTFTEINMHLYESLQVWQINIFLRKHVMGRNISSLLYSWLLPNWRKVIMWKANTAVKCALFCAGDKVARVIPWQ